MINIIYPNALAEVEQILKNTEEELVVKIPDSVRKFISENKNVEYEVKIDNMKSLDEQNILPETQAILALIYRSYWATDEEKAEFAKQDAIELERENQEKENLYPTDIFNKKETKIEEKATNNSEVTDLVIVREEKWYQKAWRKLCSIFKSKK